MYAIRSYYVQRIVDQRGFSRARNARYDRQRPKRDRRIDIFQIVLRAAVEPDELGEEVDDVV